MDYILKASAVLFIFYACYQLLLQKETFFQANRWFLLSGLIVACVIPLIVIPVYIEYTVTNTNNFAINYNNLNTAVILEEPFDYLQLAIWTYFAGILFFFGKLIIDFLSLRKVFNSSKTKTSGSYKLLETNRNITPFSFFDRIVYNPNQFKEEELTHIINHEKVHTKQWHSIDTIISHMACILFWFNPIAWLYKKALQQNLEFIADQKAQHNSLCEKSYQTVLLKTSLQNHQLVITNNFYTSLIKKRIVMLHKSKSSKMNQLKMVFVIPLLGLFMMSFNTEDIYVETPLEKEPLIELIQTEDIEQIFTKDISDDDLLIIKKKLANKGVTFGYSGIKRNKNSEITAIKTEFKYNGNSGSYNANSDKAMEPFIFKSNEDSFVVGNFTDRTPKTYTTHNGKTKVQASENSNVYVLKNNDNIKEESEIRIRNSKDTDSIRVLTNSNYNVIRTSINASQNNKRNVFVTRSEEPLFIINGEVVKRSLFEDVDPDDIKTINVLKGTSAFESYGDKGKNGVVMMFTKKSKKEFKDYSYNTNSNEEVTYKFTDNGNEELLYIVDGKVITNTQMKSLHPNNIDKLEVIKGDKALKIYGQKGKDGVVLITSKTSIFSNTNEKPVIIEVEENNPNNIEIIEVAYNDNETPSVEFIISKDASEAFLKRQKAALKKQGIEVKYSKIRRNKAGEITSIKISLDNNNGTKSSASWKEKNQGIPDIVMGRYGDDKLFVRAIGN
nr:M56 family metallopeptidase [uncultured Psychroserpens sp.]